MNDSIDDAIVETPRGNAFRIVAIAFGASFAALSVIIIMISVVFPEKHLPVSKTNFGGEWPAIMNFKCPSDLRVPNKAVELPDKIIPINRQLGAVDPFIVGVLQDSDLARTASDTGTVLYLEKNGTVSMVNWKSKECVKMKKFKLPYVYSQVLNWMTEERLHNNQNYAYVRNSMEAQERARIEREEAEKTEKKAVEDKKQLKRIVNRASFLRCPSLSSSSSGLTGLRLRLLVIDRATMEPVEEIQSELNSDYLTNIPDNLGTLILVNWSRHVLGHYEQGENCVGMNAEVRVVDVLRNVCVGKYGFYKGRSDCPQTITRSQYTVMADEVLDPSAEIAELIKGFEFQNTETSGI